MEKESRFNRLRTKKLICLNKKKENIVKEKDPNLLKSESFKKEPNKYIVKCDVNFQESFKILRTNEFLQKLNKKTPEGQTIEKTIENIKEKFENIKNRLKFDPGEDNKIGQISEIENMANNIEGVFNFDFLYKKTNKSGKIKETFEELEKIAAENGGENKIIQIELFPENEKKEEIDEMIEKKLLEITERFEKLSKKLGPVDQLDKNLGSKNESVFKNCLKFKQKYLVIEKPENYEYTEILDNFKVIKVDLEKKQDVFKTENIFQQNEINQIEKTIQYYKKNSKNEIIAKDSVMMSRTLIKMEEDLNKFQKINFDEEIKKMENKLDENQKIINNVKKLIKVDFMGKIENLNA